MNKKLVYDFRSLDWTKTLKIVLVVALLLPLMAWRPLLTTAPRTQPALLELAAGRPDERVSVIVQKTLRDTTVEALVVRLGGVVLQDLHIINAFAAELPAQAAVELAQAPGVRWVSLDAPMLHSGKLKPPTDITASGTTTLLQNTYLDTVNVRPVWKMGLQGQGVTVAVIDSGISSDNDFAAAPGGKSRLLAQLAFGPQGVSVADIFGHGTHVAGIIGGSGADSGGAYSGIAPQVNLFSLKVGDGTGGAKESDVVAALQWVYDHKTLYNIRVVNLSINSTTEQSYHTSPLDAAAEILWFDGVVVVASAGNTISNGAWYNTVNTAPANDPFVITVGATNEALSSNTNDDWVALYSDYGVTLDGLVKPDLVAPGTGIISVLSPNSGWATQHPYQVVLNGQYFRLSGTSMAAPMVSGAAALLLQDEPNLTPDQVKYRLTHTGNTIRGGLGDSRSYPYLNVYAAVTGNTTQSSNTGLAASKLLWTGNTPVAWNSLNWGSVNWGSVNWGSVNWGSVNWGSVNWGGISWDN